MKDPQFFTYIKHSFSECLISATSSFLVAVLFIWSDFLLLGDIASGWELESSQKMLIIILALILICINEFGIAFMKKGQNLARLGMELVVFSGIAIYIKGHWDEVYDGFCELIDQAIDRHNYLPIKGVSDDALTVLTLFIIFIVVFGLMISFMTRHIGAAVIISIVFMTLALAVNVAPSGAAMMFMMLGVILSSASGVAQQDISLCKLNETSVQKVRELFHRLLIKIVCVACAFAIMYLTPVFFEAPIGDLSDSKEDWEDKQKDILGDFAYLIENPFGKQGKGRGRVGDAGTVFSNSIDNTSPTYEEKELFEVWLTGELQGTLYLKNEVLGKYADGEWTSGPVTKDAINTTINENNYTRLVGFESDWDVISFYYAYYDSFTGSDTLSTYNDVMNSDGERKAVKYTALSEKTYQVCVDSLYKLPDLLNESQWTNYNNTAVSAYTKVEIDEDAARYLANLAVYVSPVRLSQPSLNSDDVNKYRYNCAVAMQKALSEYTYTLTPPKLPEGEDGIEYFIMESKQGYCMHFASAAVQGLRALGVPARYVNGYVAKRSDFEDAGDYKLAKIKDSAAHAWVEIYMERYGWVPVEVTVGYNGGDVSPAKGQDNTESQKPTESQSQSTETEKPTESQSQSASESQETTESQGQSELGSQTETETETDTTGGTADKKEEEKKAIPPIVFILPTVLLLLAAVAFAIIRSIKKDQSKLSNELRKQLYAMAVRHMNHNMYKRLKRRGKIPKNLTDQTLAQAFAKTYTDFNQDDWNKYMDIVQKATFSREEISEDEVAFVREVYTHKRRK